MSEPTPTGGSATPAVADWFTTDESPRLIGARCTECGATWFPRMGRDCPNPLCGGQEVEALPLSPRGTVWSYTDAQYQPPPPYIAAPGDYQPFALAAVELADGMVVLGQLAHGYGVDDVRVGSPVELVVEPLYVDESGERLIWRWRPVSTEEQQ